MRLVARAAGRGVVELYRSDGLTHAASIAFYALLSIFPFFLLLFSVIGGLTEDPQARDSVVAFVFRYFPRQFDFISGQIDSFRTDRLGIGVGGGLGLAYASLGVFNAMSTAVNHAWGVEKRRSFIRHRLFSFLMMLSAGAMFVMAIAIVGAVRVVEARWFSSLQLRGAWLDRLQGVGADWAALALLVVCVALIFRFVPNARISFGEVWPGAIVTAVLWRVAFAFFSQYTADLSQWTVHGSVAAVVVFLLWIYISAVVLLYGVEMTAAYVRLRVAVGREPGLTGATPASPEADG
ncbi:MAG: YihY/virulence factor BrkB family protein [Acidobacteria bacterium]|nr:YihY/virulence factor BrkB family protein [Acidobacteriota bacterium]